jgi:hypothetical protein
MSVHHFRRTGVGDTAIITGQGVDIAPNPREHLGRGLSGRSRWLCDLNHKIPVHHGEIGKGRPSVLLLHGGKAAADRSEIRGVGRMQGKGNAGQNDRGKQKNAHLMLSCS